MEDIDYELLYILCFSNIKIRYRKHVFINCVMLSPLLGHRVLVFTI